MSSNNIKRIKADIRELAQNPSSSLPALVFATAYFMRREKCCPGCYIAAPVEDNLFLWHFTVRGPADTDFAGGIYHGRISLPPEYPFKPPSIMLLTPNGRFETNKKICLSLTAHHPEHWQPAWGIRTILEALVAFRAGADSINVCETMFILRFFPTPADSSIGTEVACVLHVCKTSLIMQVPYSGGQMNALHLLRARVSIPVLLLLRL